MSITTDDLPMRHLYTQYAPALLGYLIQLTGSREEAKDLVQKTFLKVLSHSGPSASTGNVEAWLYTIARNTAYDRFRRHQRRPVMVYNSINLDRVPSADTTAQIGEHDDIHAALCYLPEAYHVPLLLQVVAGYTLQELAAVLGVKLGTVKSRLHRARARFRAVYTSP